MWKTGSDFKTKFFTKVIKKKVKQGDKHITVCLKQGYCVKKIGTLLSYLINHIKILSIFLFGF